MKIKLINQMNCPICREKLDQENSKPYTTECGHLFCESCFQKLINNQFDNTEQEKEETEKSYILID